MVFATACGGRADQGSMAPAAVEADRTMAVDPTPSATEPSPGEGESSPPAPTPPAPETIGDATPPPRERPARPQPAPESPPTQPESISIEGCREVGGYDRVFIFQRDASTGICTDFWLVSPDDDATPQPNLSLPERWAVEDMSSFGCTLDGSPVSDSTRTYFTRADGNISFSGNEGALPLHVQLDVVLSSPAEDMGTPASELISRQRLEAEDIELLGGCSSLRD
jgi:hypothetical protein